MNNFNVMMSRDENQTIRLQANDDSDNIKRQGGINETGNDTIAGVVAAMNRESNQRSETGGDDYQNHSWVKEKRAENMDLGGPSGTGSSELV